MTLVYKSLVAATPAAPSTAAQSHFQAKLGYETDCADVHHDIQHGVNAFVLVDVRSPEAYQRSHVPQAINLPVARITPAALADYPPDTLFVVYCWGPGCNGATKAALRFSELGYPVKEMLGGIEYWEDRERYPIERGAVS
ncbi:MAG: rhodanese-like domain-containing protein [Anaerolineae bacterium]|nr:rhodanese-like domain-containing protein [Anaerolineae bacterium]